jgi:DNA processing protein
MNACHPCLRRMWLIELMAPRINRQRAMVDKLLSLSDLELITLLGGQQETELLASYAVFGRCDAQAMIDTARAAGLSLVCRHADEYPDQLRALETLAPAVLAVNGSLERLVNIVSRPAVAIVGTRRATRYGLAAAHKMARDLTAAGMTVVSGMAFGIDSAAHEGALAANGRTLAVLAGPPQRAYPSRKTRLFEQIVSTGAVISELGPEMSTWRWALQARNRVIAGLALATIVIEAPKRSGALITARHADRVGRWIGVLPGPVGISQSAGTNLLLAKGMAGRQVVDPAHVKAVRNAQDVLDMIFGESRVEVPPDLRQAPTASEAALLAKITAGLDNVTRIDAGMLVDLTALELKGWVVRGAGGALTVLGTE